MLNIIDLSADGTRLGGDRIKFGAGDFLLRQFSVDAQLR
jgi:hypothetical protein